VADRRASPDESDDEVQVAIAGCSGLRASVVLILLLALRSLRRQCSEAQGLPSVKALLRVRRHAGGAVGAVTDWDRGVEDGKALAFQAAARS
jgi:hypothetical protein